MARSFRGAAPWLALVLGVCATLIYGRIVDHVYPIRLWLFWPLLLLWGYVALFSAACTSLGQWLIVRVLKLRELPPLESAVFSMASGVVGFVLLMYAAGALGWYNRVFALALPLCLLALGGGDAVRLGRRLLLELRHAPPRGPFQIALGAAGVCCIALLYLGAMTPDSLNYDSTWCHLTIAQDYARAGRIVAFPADYTKNVPQLASLIHTWGFLLPGLDQPLRWMLVLHNELGLLLWTLAGVGAGVRVLVRDPKLRGAWVSFFLFPIIFVYDNNLGGAADHVCAFFAVPIMIAALRVCDDFSRGHAALAAIACAGALMTKYQAVYLIVPAAAIIAAYWAKYLVQVRRRGSAARVALSELRAAPLLMLGLGAALISPHFIRQTLFHHNPFYPLMQDVFRGSTPTLPDASRMFSLTISDPAWIPRGTALQKLWHACKLFVTFSFEPHYSFNGNVPVFGSLFTLLLPAIVLVPERRRLVLAALMASGALLIWGVLYNVDRNLQIFMPVMVCVTCAVLVKLWRVAGVARAGLVPLVALQVVWGADALFYSSYGRIHSSIDLIRSGFEGHAASRFDGYRRVFVEIGEALPKDARILLHASHVSLGIDREVYLDWYGFQALISYRNLRSAREVIDYYRSLGITHLLFEPGARPSATKQEDVLWAAVVNRHAIRIGDYGHLRLLRMPDTTPPEEAPYRVSAFGLDGYADGVYPIESMDTDEYMPLELRHFAAPAQALPAQPEARAALVELSDAVFVGPRAALDDATALVLQRAFNRAATTGQVTLYLKNTGQKPEGRTHHHPR